MQPAPGKSALDEQSRTVLVRTLGVVSLLYALFGALVAILILLAAPASRAPGGLYEPRLFGTMLLAHALVLCMAAEALLRGRRWAWPATLLAAAGSAFFAVLELLKANVTNAVLDAVYALLAVALFAVARRRA